MISRIIEAWHAGNSIESITAPMARIRVRLEKKAAAHAKAAGRHADIAAFYESSAKAHGEEVHRVNKAVAKYGEFVF